MLRGTASVARSSGPASRSGHGVCRVVLAPIVVAAPAHADSDSDVVTIGDALVRAGVLRPLGGSTPGEAERPGQLEDGVLTIEGMSGEVRLRPVAPGPMTRADSGVAVVRNTPDSVYALTTADHGANAAYSVILGPDAPQEFRYELAVDGLPASLVDPGNGALEERNASGGLANIIAPPWARDASGRAVPTEYTVDGNVLIQTVRHHEGLQYPVVADPRFACDGLWCTVELSRADTAAAADNLLSGGIVCSFLPPPGVPACAVVIVALWAHANVARANGQCSAYRVWQANLISFAHLAYVRSYA